MENEKLEIAWLYPDMLNLHGDRGNIQAFEKVANDLGITVNITKIEDYDDDINFENTDIILVNPGELRVIKKVIESLQRQKDNLEDYINKNKYIVLIGTSGTVMAKSTYKLDGTVIYGLGYLDMECTQREYIYGDDIYFELENEDKTEIIGSQIQVIDTSLNECAPLGKVKYGLGNNGKKHEGARYKNIIFTNCLGPVFVKNPHWVEIIIKEAMKNKNVVIEKKLVEEAYEIESKSNDAIKKFIASKQLQKGD